jgi:hypothetical protein
VAGGRAAPRADRRWIEPSQEVFFPSSTRSLTFSPPGWQAVCTRGSPPGHLEGCLSFLSPGLMETDALRYFPERERMVKFAESYTPLGRIGQAQDMADAVRLLVSPQAAFITGQVLVVDGGLSLL